jgi:HD-like signal output (HDOD) protein
LQSEASDDSIYRRVVSQLMPDDERVPSLPTITLATRRALGDPNIALNTLGRLICSDPALSARLMKHVASALIATP